MDEEPKTITVGYGGKTVVDDSLAEAMKNLPPRSSDMDGMMQRLKNSIERDGHFNEPLNDMAEGYAAGRGTSFFEAKNAIKDRFYEQQGMSPKEYLDKSYSEKPKYARQENGNSNGNTGNANTTGNQQQQTPTRGRRR